MELVHHYSSKAAGVEFYNPGYYKIRRWIPFLRKPMSAPDQEAAIPVWQQVDWNGKTGTGIKGDAVWRGC